MIRAPVLFNFSKKRAALIFALAAVEPEDLYKTLEELIAEA